VQAGGPVYVLAGEVEGDGEAPGTAGPLEFAAEVDLAILFGGSDGGYEVEILGMEGLSEVCGDGDDCVQKDGAFLDLNFGRFEEANWFLSASLRSQCSSTWSPTVMHSFQGACDFE